jgi:hypothetical protein
MRIIRLALAFVLISLAFVIVEIYIGRVSDRSASRYFRSLFLGNGIALTLLALKGGVRNLSRILGGAQRPIIVLYLWLVSGCLFVILFSPFMATRHVLLVILPCSLLIACFVETGFSRFWGAAALLLTVFLTMALGISDRMWAGYYKEKAALIQSELADRKADIYFSGHWGWQWYAKQKGMKELEASKPEIKPGDYLVYPESIPQQALDHIPSRLHLELVKVYTAPPRKLTFFKTDEGRFYSSSHGLPWAVNLRPFAPIKVYRVR